MTSNVYIAGGDNPLCSSNREIAERCIIERCLMRPPTYIIDFDLQQLEAWEFQKLENKAEVLAYLNSFDALAWAGKCIVDVFTGETVELPAVATYVDGDWCWDSADIYYFDKYDARLNREFVSKFESDRSC